MSSTGAWWQWTAITTTGPPRSCTWPSPNTERPTHRCRPFAEYRKANPPMPPVTDDAAYVEAERRYPPSDSSTMYPLDAVRTLMRGAFEDGAKWAAGRAETTITTTEVVEQLTKAAHETANAGIPARFFTRQAQAEAYQRGVDDWADEQGHTVPNPYAVPEEEL